MTGALTWISTWIIMIVFLAIIAQTSWGRSVVYWLMWLAVTLLLVMHADELTSLFNVQALNLNG